MCLIYSLCLRCQELICTCVLSQIDHVVKGHTAYSQLQGLVRQRSGGFKKKKKNFSWDLHVWVHHVFCWCSGRVVPTYLSCFSGAEGENIYSYLNRHLSLMVDSGSAVDLLGSSLHVFPDFHGNRSPLADPTLKGMVSARLNVSNSDLNYELFGIPVVVCCSWWDCLSPRAWMT